MQTYWGTDSIANWRFGSRSRDPQAIGMDAQVNLWNDFNLIYAFPLFGGQKEDIPVILITRN